jgi:hypothetical protein
VLIGQEVASQDLAAGAPLFLLARGAIAEDYGLALTSAGITFALVDPEPLTALGLLGIATHAGLLPST